MVALHQHPKAIGHIMKLGLPPALTHQHDSLPTRSGAKTDRLD
jgi:hypothetical protein